MRVRGECKNGHLLEVDAPKDRVTWRGPCPEEGCGEPIICRRAPKAASSSSSPASPAAPGGPVPIVKVARYRDDDSIGFSDDLEPAGELAGDDGGGSGSPGVHSTPAPELEPGSADGGGDPDEPAGGELADELVDEPGSDDGDLVGGRRRRRRFVRSRSAEPGPGDDDWRAIPGIY